MDLYPHESMAWAVIFRELETGETYDFDERTWSGDDG